MELINVIQRVGFFISKEILKTPADVTDAINSLSGYAFLPSAETEDDDKEQSLRLELRTKDKKQMVVVDGANVNVIRYKTADNELLNPIQQHLDTAIGILEKLKAQFGFEVINVAMESGYIVEATEEVSKIIYKKLNAEEDIPVAWRFNRMYKRTADVDGGIASMEHATCLRDEIQLEYEQKSSDRIILEFAWGTMSDDKPTEETIFGCFRYFIDRINKSLRIYNGN